MRSRASGALKGGELAWANSKRRLMTANAIVSVASASTSPANALRTAVPSWLLRDPGDLKSPC